MQTTNTLIDRKKREAMRLLSSSVSNKKIRGQNIETVINVISRQMEEVQLGGTEWKTLDKERSLLLRKYNPALYATMQQNEGTLFLTNSLIGKVQSSASQIIQKAKISTELSSGVSRFNSSVARAYGSYAKDAGGLKTPLMKTQFIQKVFSTQKVGELQEAFNAANTSKTATYSDRMMAEARLDMRHNLDMIAKAAGIDSSSMGTINKQLSFGVSRMERIQRLIAEGKTISDFERLGYNKKEYQKAKIIIEKTYGTKKIDSGFLLEDNIFGFLKTKGLFGEKYIDNEGRPVEAKVYRKNPSKYRIDNSDYERFAHKMESFEKGRISGDDLDEKTVNNLINTYRELFGFDTEGFTAGLNESTDGHGVLSRNTDKVDEFQEMIERLSGSKISRDVLDETLEVVQENRRAVLSGGAIETIKKVIEERAVGGGSVHFEGGKLTELHQMKLMAERLRTGTKQDFGLQNIISVIDNAIIASGGDRRQLSALQRAAKGTSLWSLRQAQQAPLQAMMMSNWQNLYGGAIANTGSGSLMPDIFRGRVIGINDYSEVSERIAVPGYDEATGQFIGGKYWDTQKVVKAINFKGYTDIAKGELGANRDMISVASQTQKTASKEIIEELTQGKASYNISSVFEWMLSKSDILEEGRVSMSDIEKALNGNKTAIGIFNDMSGVYRTAKAVGIEQTADNMPEVLRLFNMSITRAFGDIDTSNSSGIMGSTSRFSEEQMMRKQKELADMFQTIFPQLSTIQEASKTAVSNAVAQRATQSAFARPTLKIHEGDARKSASIMGKRFYGESFGEVIEQATEAFGNRALTEEIRASAWVNYSESGISKYIIDEEQLSDSSLAFGKKLKSVKEQVLRDVFKSEAVIEVKQFEPIEKSATEAVFDFDEPIREAGEGQVYRPTETKEVSLFNKIPGYFDDKGNFVSETVSFGDTTVTRNHADIIESLLNSIVNANSKTMSNGEDTRRVLASGLAALLDSDERIREILGDDVVTGVRTNIEKMLTGKAIVSFDSPILDGAAAADDTQQAASQLSMQKQFAKINEGIREMMEELGIQRREGEIVVGRDGKVFYKDEGGTRNIAALLDLETKDRRAIDSTLMGVRDELYRAGDNRKLKEQIRTRAMRDINIEGMRNFTIDIAEEGKYLTLQGTADDTGKNISYIFRATGGEIKQITADDIAGDSFRLFGEFRGKDFVGHSAAPSSIVQERLTSLGKEVFGDKYDEKLQSIASNYFGMESDKLSGDDIIRAFSATEDLPLHSLKDGVMREDLIANVTGIRPTGNTVMRPSELLGLAMQNEGEFADSEFKKIGELMRVVSGNRGPDIDADEEAAKAAAVFKETISGTNVGRVAQGIIDNDFNVVDLPDKLFRASKNAPAEMLMAGSKFLSSVRAGEHNIPLAMAAITLATLVAAGTYSKGKEMMGTDPTNGPSTRISMRDEGYDNSATPDRYSSGGSSSSSGLSSLSSLSSATINDNLSSITSRDLESMLKGS